MNDRPLEPTAALGEDGLDIGVRPKFLKDFQGQKELKANLSIFINAAKTRGEPLDHVFLSGPPGLGKTTLAYIVANELGAELKITSAPAIERPKDLAGMLSTIPKNTVFFIDEIHRLRPAIEEMLYIAMEDYELDWIIGQGPAARTVRIPVPPFTLVGATTKPGKVTSPLFSRFGITIRIEFYQPVELEWILRRTAGILDITIEKNASSLLARCSRGTPRVANRLLRRMRDFAQVKGVDSINQRIIESGLERLKIDTEGLEEQDRRILTVIIDNYGGGPVGAETLAISIGEGIDTLEDFYEPYLIQKGFLARTPRGRVVTDLAHRHLGRKPGASQPFLI
ncbi:Holliday junction DNA helicase RuvB [Olavius algarvensis spirochete endosymbiont]|uniref:Holliday junction branch migration DNA helicase RuvB n=1 Tax=Olavius algarvensis spirochete endosymbiont TaxID=260710 RepID=UPI000F2C0E51|nr:Holliday junction branch migration DNA helicase RuvB [Olavius algarvensis spirochete endosymbiont]VDA99836.1 Holliday junction DNA helicase RuvB [Olavius algarvensis spirochete endosymbiont]